MRATLRLFKAVPVRGDCVQVNLDLVKSTIPLGFIFSPKVMAEYLNYEKLITDIEDIYGMSAEKLNSSFHKSWAKIKDTSQEELVVEQLAHYVTTYGREGGSMKGYL
ncbi:MAG: hypothetical protein ACOC56_06720, partial [Atribacterota bacterium]